jgi:predicted Zn-dependent peptidase
LAIYEQIKRLSEEDVPAEELQKIKNQFAAGEYRRISGDFPILMQLVRSEGLGDWREINEAGAKMQGVTVADIRRVAKQYFSPQNRTVAILTRKAGGSVQKAVPATRPTR